MMLGSRVYGYFSIPMQIQRRITNLQVNINLEVMFKFHIEIRIIRINGSMFENILGEVKGDELSYDTEDELVKTIFDSFS